MSYANRGMSFELLINITNERYKEKGLAFIEKKPTPIKVLSRRKDNKLIACFEKKSSVDYSGVCQARSIYFEAKTTKNRTRFPLDNIHSHQTETLKMVHEQGAIAFFLIEFSKHHEVYILPIKEALEWLDEAENGGRKSIPYDWFVTHCELVQTYKDIPLHYLSRLGVFG
jgi:recombination protein U